MSQFQGFPPEAVRFLLDLRQNNNKAWFEAHRQDYEAFVLEPARLLVTVLGERLQDIAPNIQADPRVNGSIFRIHRDTRFSKDKSPYKTHLGLWFWEGSRPKLECSGFYLQLEPPNLMLAAGIYAFTKDQLPEYRAAVVHPVHGAELAAVVDEVREQGFSLGIQHYKRVPRGCDPAHPNASLLLHSGLSAGVEDLIPDSLYSPQLVDFAVDKFAAMAPLHRWLVELIERVPEPAPSA